MKGSRRKTVILREGDDTLVSFGGSILLDEFIHRLGLPGMHKKRLLKAVRYRFFNVAARVIHHGRYMILSFARGMHRCMDLCYAYHQIRSLRFG